MTRTPEQNRAWPRLRDELAARFGSRVSTAQSIRERHGQDESWHAPAPPDAVVFPQTTGEVAEIVRACARHRVPIIAFGVGTSLEGHVAALHGGVCIDMSRMNRVLAVHVEDMDARVEAGVTRKQLNAELKDTGLFEFHGTEAGVAEQAAMVGELARGNGGADFRWATRPEERSRLWQARHDAYYGGLSLRAGARGYVTDVCVPISRLAECVTATKQDIERSGLIAPIVGHVGDGNFHLVILVDPNDAGEVSRAAALNEQVVRRALAHGGTCSGEHGVGYGKLPFMGAEHGDALALMHTIKFALDPHGLMNPGKIIAGSAPGAGTAS